MVSWGLGGRRWGALSRPVRSAGDLTINSDSYWWVGAAVEDGESPIGPHGPWGVTGRLPSSVERATALIVGPLCSVLPWRVYRGSWRGSDAADLGPRLWMTDPMLCGNTQGSNAQGDPIRSVYPVWNRRPAGAVWSEWVRHALWFGRGWITYAEAGNPEPGAPFAEPVAGTVLNLSPSMVSDCDTGWEIGVEGDRMAVDRDGRYRMGGRTWRLLALHEPFGSGGVFGRHAADLKLAVQVRGYASGTFRSGIPAGYLKVNQPNVTKEQAEKLQARWMETHGGSDRRSIAVLNSLVDFNAISVTPVDAQLVEVDHMTLRMVAHAFNLSARALDSGASAGNTYANIQDERRDRLDDTIMPWKRQVEDTLSAVLPAGTWLELETRGYLETDPIKRTDYYTAGLAGGWLHPDEIRPLERLPRRES